MHAWMTSSTWLGLMIQNSVQQCWPAVACFRQDSEAEQQPARAVGLCTATPRWHHDHFPLCVQLQGPNWTVHSNAEGPLLQIMAMSMSTGPVALTGKSWSAKQELLLQPRQQMHAKLLQQPPSPHTHLDEGAGLMAKVRHHEV